MTSKQKGHNNLFTLNESIKYGQKLNTDQSSILEEPSEIDINDDQTNRQQIQKLLEELDIYKKQAQHLKFINKEIKDSLDILKGQNIKHQEKQRQLIKKLSHEQIANKQLEFQVRKFNEELLKIRESAKNHDTKNTTLSQSLKKAEQERALFIQSFKKVCEAISKCQRGQQFQSCVQKFLEFIRKNIKSYEMHGQNQQFEFDLKFEMGQMSMIRGKNNELENKIGKLKQQLEKERAQKKKLGANFNEKILKLKEQCDQLRSRLNEINYKMSERENEVEIEINTLKKTISQKNEIISELKYKIDSEKKGKDSICSKKSRVKKRSYYISDGQRDGQPLTQIQNQIQDLERQLIQVIEDFKS